MAKHHQRAPSEAQKSAKPIPDSRIDLSDIPEATDAALRRARRVGQPATGNSSSPFASPRSC